MEELLAQVVEVLDSFRLMYAQTNSKPGASIPDPIKVPRPHEEPKKPIGWRDFGRMIVKGG